MIFTVAFDYSPLDRAQKKQVLDIVTKELLTPKGLRTPVSYTHLIPHLSFNTLAIGAKQLVVQEALDTN